MSEPLGLCARLRCAADPRPGADDEKTAVKPCPLCGQGVADEATQHAMKPVADAIMFGAVMCDLEPVSFLKIVAEEIKTLRARNAELTEAIKKAAEKL